MVAAPDPQYDFETAARECRPFLLKIAVASARNPVDAEDIVQEALLRVSGNAAVSGDCPLRIWLSRIVVRVAINHHRSAARRLKRWICFCDMEKEQEDGNKPEFDPADHSKNIPHERMMDVKRQVNRLPTEFKVPLLMLAVDGMTIPELRKFSKFLGDGKISRLLRPEETPWRIGGPIEG
jgi:DNA-directed RNA polymerase specialized sigma24 family protein